MDFFSESWCNIQWTPWAKLQSLKSINQLIKDVPGVYRIRPIGYNELIYIGQTSKLNERIKSLRANYDRAEMPFNDPHTAAPCLWAWRDAEGFEYEWSTSDDVPENKQERMGLECYLLWKYRLEKGESTKCNFGRFHVNYVKSRDRSKKFRGHRLTDQVNEKANGPSMPPLQLIGNPTGQEWMGLTWSIPLTLTNKIKDAPARPGLYKIQDTEQNITYIGQSINLKNRLLGHKRKISSDSNLTFSYHQLGTAILDFQLHELENDIIGSYYKVSGKVPKYQFSNEEEWI